MRAGLSAEALLALFALRDLRVIRASVAHPAYRELWDCGVATFRTVAGRADVLDYRLVD